MLEHNRPHHIQHCLKPSNHVGLRQAKTNWKNALGVARIALDKSKRRKKRQRVTEATAPHRKASTLNDDSQISANVNAEERTQNTSSNPPVHDIAGNSQDQGRIIAPDRAPFSHAYTIDGPLNISDEDIDAFVQQQLSAGSEAGVPALHDLNVVPSLDARSWDYS